MAGFRLRVRGAVVPDGGGATLPTTQSITFGAKTRRGHGGHACGNTGGTLTITSDPSGLFAIDTHNKLVLSGTYGNAPPALSGTYTVVVSNGVDSSTITIPVEANVYNITNIDSGTNADTASSNQGKTVYALASRGDDIRLRDGTEYNNVEPVITSGASTWTWAARNDPAIEDYFAGLSVGTLNADYSVDSAIPDGDWIKVSSDTPYGANIRRLLLLGSSGNNTFGLWFYRLNFHRSFVATTFAASDAGLVIGNNLNTGYGGYVRMTECDFQSTTEILDPPSLISGIQGQLGTHSVLIEDCTFSGLYSGVTIRSTRGDAALASIDSDIWIVGSDFDNIYEDCRRIDNAAPVYTLWNVSRNGKQASPATHPDSEQRRFEPGAPAGTYAWGVCVGNVAFRGVGTPGSIEFQGAPFQTMASTGITLTGAVVAGNLYIGTGGHMGTLDCCVDPIIKFNSGLLDRTAGITVPSTPNYSGIDLVSGTGGSVLYNVMGLAISLEGTQTALDEETGNILLDDASTDYPLAFVDPDYGPDLATLEDALTKYRWKAAGTLDPANTGLPYQVGAVTDYIDHVNRTASFPV